MTLLDAPTFDEKRAKRRRITGYSTAAGLVLLFILYWLLAGRPVDWPWRWHNHMFGRMAINAFMKDLEKNDLPAAYGVWIKDKDWQQHPQQHGSFTFERFKNAWDPASPDAEYTGGSIHAHHIAASRIYGNVLLVAILVNGAQKDALDLTWDPHTRQLNFAPPGVKLSTVPWGMVP